MTGRVAPVRCAAGVEEQDAMPFMAYRYVTVPVNQAIDWQRTKFSVDSLFNSLSRPPPVNQANLEAIDVNNFFDRNSRYSRVHIASHTMYHVSFEHVEQTRVNQISGMQYHIDGVEEIFYQADKQCPGIFCVGKVGI